MNRKHLLQPSLNLNAFFNEKTIKLDISCNQGIGIVNSDYSGVSRVLSGLGFPFKR